MPQPFTAYLPSDTSHWEAAFHTKQLIEHPLSRHVLATISYWSHADLTIMCLGTRFLQADFSIAYEMLRSLKAENVRMAAIGAAAAACLDDTGHGLYLAAMRAVRPSKKQRHKFAHHLFGETSLIPGSLLLIDPKYVGESIYKRSELEPQTLNDGNLGWDMRSEEGLKDIEVYCEDELIKIAETAQQCERIMYLLHLALGQGEGRDQSRTALLDHPLVQPQFQRLSGQS